MKFWANILLGIWLILTGLVFLGGIHFAGIRALLAVLGIASGVLFLVMDRGESLAPRLANVLLGAWLIVGELMPLLHLSFRGIGVVMSILAVAAGVLVLIRR